MAKSQYVIDLKPGDKVESTFVVAKKQLLRYKDSSRGSYMNLVLCDRTGEVEAKVWDNAEAAYNTVMPEAVVHVHGTAEEFRGTLQIIVSSLKVLDEGIEPEDFLPSTEKDIMLLKADLQATILSVQDTDLKKLLRVWFDDETFYNAYVTAPAAKKIHHAYLGGLLEHSLEVSQLAEKAAELYDMADRDLLVTGALLHDIGKLKEFRYSRVIDVTDKGRLLGHTVLGYQMLMERIASLPDFPDSKATHLGHLIVSHHGEYAYGAPALPQTLEAAVIHYCDLLSSRVKQFAQKLSNHQDGPWTDYDKVLGRLVYVGFSKV